MRELVAMLRQQADKIELSMEQLEQLNFPTQLVNVEHAMLRLRRTVGNDLHLLIQMPDINSYGFERRLVVGAWKVYLGKESKAAHGYHSGTSLDNAVTNALDAWKEAMLPNTAEDVEEEFTEPLPM